MAINQVSLSFFAPRWRQRLTPDPTALTDIGTPVQIVDYVPVEDAVSVPVSAEVVVGWLAERGFTPARWGEGRILERGQIQSIFGLEQHIIAHVHEDAGEFSGLYIRFTLSPNVASPMAEWAQLVVALCERFSLRMEPDGTGSCNEAAIVAAMRNDQNYQRFATTFGWEAPGPGTESDAVR
jgi:hypothetical protein